MELTGLLERMKMPHLSDQVDTVCELALRRLLTDGVHLIDQMRHLHPLEESCQFHDPASS